jgi:hypothetical protein
VGQAAQLPAQPWRSPWLIRAIGDDACTLLGIEQVVPMPPGPRGAAAYGGWLQSYESGLLSRRDGAIRVTLPESEEQLTLAEYNPAHVRKTTELDLLPVPQRATRLRSWLDHERPPPGTPEPVYASASYDDVSGRASYQAMQNVVRGSPLRSVSTSGSDQAPSQPRAASRRGGYGKSSSLPALSRGAAPTAGGRRQRGRRGGLYNQRAGGLNEDARWKLHAGYDPFMSTEEVLALGELDASEEELVHRVMSQQAREETFCTWLLNRPLLEPILDNTNPALQRRLDALAEATLFAVERRSRQLEVRYAGQMPVCRQVSCSAITAWFSACVPDAKAGVAAVCTEKG